MRLFELNSLIIVFQSDDIKRITTWQKRNSQIARTMKEFKSLYWEINV